MCELCVYYSSDPDVRYQVELRNRTLRDINSAISRGEARGIAKGMAKAEARAIERVKLENARNLLKLLDDVSIATAIGLDLETVSKLRAEVL